MSQRELTFTEALLTHNRRVECTLKRRFDMTLATYKTIEAIAELAVVALAFYAIYNDADPLTVFALTSVVIGGWKVVEFLIVYADELSAVRDAKND